MELLARSNKIQPSRYSEVSYGHGKMKQRMLIHLHTMNIHNSKQIFIKVWLEQEQCTLWCLLVSNGTHDVQINLAYSLAHCRAKLQQPSCIKSIPKSTCAVVICQLGIVQNSQRVGGDSYLDQSGKHHLRLVVHPTIYREIAYRFPTIHHQLNVFWSNATSLNQSHHERLWKPFNESTSQKEWKEVLEEKSEFGTPVEYV